MLRTKKLNDIIGNKPFLFTRTRTNNPVRRKVSRSLVLLSNSLENRCVYFLVSYYGNKPCKIDTKIIQFLFSSIVWYSVAHVIAFCNCFTFWGWGGGGGSRNRVTVIRFMRYMVAGAQNKLHNKVLRDYNRRPPAV